MTQPESKPQTALERIHELEDACAVLEQEAHMERLRARDAVVAHRADMRRWAEREAWLTDQIVQQQAPEPETAPEG